MAAVVVTRADPKDGRVDALIERHLDLMRAVSPPESVFAQDAEGLARDGARIFVARMPTREGVPDEASPLLGIGAYKVIAPSHAELKSMHVAAEARGQGIGMALLTHLLEAALQEGLVRASLETGRAAAFVPAIGMYRSAGFKECGPFGSYTRNPFSLFLTRVPGGHVAPSADT